MARQAELTGSLWLHLYNPVSLEVEGLKVEMKTPVSRFPDPAHKTSGSFQFPHTIL